VLLMADEANDSQGCYTDEEIGNAHPSTAGTADEGTGIPGPGASWIGSARLTACPPARLRATAAATAAAPARSQKSCQQSAPQNRCSQSSTERDHAFLSPMGDKPAGARAASDANDSSAAGQPRRPWSVPDRLARLPSANSPTGCCLLVSRKFSA
jgi:hypothetical protein